MLVVHDAEDVAERVHHRRRRETWAALCHLLVRRGAQVEQPLAGYLVTGTEKGQRTFRVDRIIAAEPTDTPAERPSDFTLSEAWERVVDEIESKLSQTWATVLVDATHLHVLRDHFGRHCVPEGAGPDGRIQVRVGASTALNIATQLAGWGSMAEVIEPEAVRRELARIGAELSRYS